MALGLDTFLVNFIAVLSVGNGALMAFTTNVAANKYGFDVKRGTAAYLLLEGMGYITLGNAVTLLLSSKGEFKVAAALGYGMTLRLFWLIKSIALGSFAKAGVRTDKIGAVTTVASACTYVLLSGNGNADVAGKIIVAIIGVSSMLIFLNPDLASRFIFGMGNVVKLGKGSNVTRGVLHAFGKTNLVNVALMAALVLGAAPERALGYCNAMWAVAELCGLATKHHLDLGKGMSTNVVTFAIAAFSAGTLLF